MAWQDSHMHMLSLHERLVKCWGMCKVWCVILYLICALGNGMEARFHHWLKQIVIATFYLTILWKKSELWDKKLQ